MPKPLRFPETVSMRLPKGTGARIRAVMTKDEDRGDFVRRLFLTALERVARLRAKLERDGA